MLVILFVMLVPLIKVLKKETQVQGADENNGIFLNVSFRQDDQGKYIDNPGMVNYGIYKKNDGSGNETDPPGTPDHPLELPVNRFGGIETTKIILRMVEKNPNGESAILPMVAGNAKYPRLFQVDILETWKLNKDEANPNVTNIEEDMFYTDGQQNKIQLDSSMTPEQIAAVDDKARNFNVKWSSSGVASDPKYCYVVISMLKQPPAYPIDGNDVTNQQTSNYNESTQVRLIAKRKGNQTVTANVASYILSIRKPPTQSGLDVVQRFDVLQGYNSYVNEEFPNVTVITQADNDQRGGMWYNKSRLDLTKDFQTKMYIYSGVNDYSNITADGITFTFQNDLRDKFAIGEVGSGIGAYSQTTGSQIIHNAISLEFDTAINHRGNTPTEIKDQFFWDEGYGWANGRHIALMRPDTNENMIKDDDGVVGQLKHNRFTQPITGQYDDTNDATMKDTRFKTLANGQWSPLIVKWNHEDRIFEYWVNFDYKNLHTLDISTLPTTVGGEDANGEASNDGWFYRSTERKGKLNYEEVFGKDKDGGYTVRWGFTGSTGGLMSYQAVAIEELPQDSGESGKTVRNTAISGEVASLEGTKGSVGDVVEFELEARNSADPGEVTSENPLEMKDVIIRDTLEDGLAFVHNNETEWQSGPLAIEASIDGGINWTPTTTRITLLPTGQQKLEYLDPNNVLKPGESLKIRFKSKIIPFIGSPVKENEMYMIKNQGIISSRNSSGDIATNIVTIERQEVLANIKKEVTNKAGTAGNEGATAKVGETLRYTLTVATQEDSVAWKAIYVEDLLPEGLSYQTNSLKVDGNNPINLPNGETQTDAKIWNDQQMTLYIGTISSNQQKIITFEARVNGNGSGQTIENSAVAKGQYRDESDLKIEVTSNKVETAIDAVTLNLRQVVLTKNDGLVLPKTAEFSLINSQLSPVKEGKKMGWTVDSDLDVNKPSFKQQNLLIELSYLGYLVKPVIPMNYQLVGYVLTDKKIEHLKADILKTAVPILDYQFTPDYWLSVYLNPNSLNEKDILPYSLDGKVNEFGQIQ